ncbi:hypothetical protein D3C86_2036150 [compost metagenome]
MAGNADHRIQLALADHEARHQLLHLLGRHRQLHRHVFRLCQMRGHHRAQAVDFRDVTIDLQVGAGKQLHGAGDFGQAAGHVFKIAHHATEVL